MGEDAPGRGFRVLRPLPPVAGVPRDLAVETETGDEVEVTQFARSGELPPAFRELVERHAAIGHPLVAPILAWTEPPAGDLDAPLLVEGHDDGPRLAEAARPLDRERALLVGADLADVLAALHADGLVHGGLAADAVVLSADGRPRVVGAGVAAMQEAALGQPAPADRDDDLRALGGILYELLCGSPPDDPPRAPIELVSDLSPAANGLVASLLSADPHRPPPPAAAVSLRLRELADEVATTLPATEARAAAVPPPVVRRARLRSAAARAPIAIDGPVALAAAFLALAGILAAYGISRGNERAAGAVTLRLTHTVTFAAETLTLTAPFVPTGPTTASVPTFDTTTTAFPTTTGDTTLTPGAGATTVFSTETIVSTVNVGSTVEITRTTVPARTYTYTFSTVISTPRRTSTTVQGQTTITTPRG